MLSPSSFVLFFCVWRVSLLFIPIIIRGVLLFPLEWTSVHSLFVYRQHLVRVFYYSLLFLPCMLSVWLKQTFKIHSLPKKGGKKNRGTDNDRKRKGDNNNKEKEKTTPQTKRETVTLLLWCLVSIRRKKENQSRKRVKPYEAIFCEVTSSTQTWWGVSDSSERKHTHTPRVKHCSFSGLAVLEFGISITCLSFPHPFYGWVAIIIFFFFNAMSIRILSINSIHLPQFKY